MDAATLRRIYIEETIVVPVVDVRRSRYEYDEISVRTHGQIVGVLIGAAAARRVDTCEIGHISVDDVDAYTPVSASTSNG